MSRKGRVTNDYEDDAFGSWRHVYRWRPGERKQIKRQYSRRDRRKSRQEIRKEGGAE